MRWSKDYIIYHSEEYICAIKMCETDFVQIWEF